MEYPLISVIITNYNYGKYVARAIRSVFKQTYPNIELIIINDGSTDNSDEIIKGVLAKNSDKNVVYVNRENKGVVYTRNEGIELAKGDYICYLDADDHYNADYISKNYAVAAEFDADVVYPNWHYEGEWTGRPDTDFPEFTPKLLQLQKLHVTPASLVRKAAIGKRRFEVEKVAEDWDFFIGLSLDGAKFKLAKDNTINYNVRSGTRSSKHDPRTDTYYFSEILKKYKASYGDKVIDHKKLVRLRHPHIIVRAGRKVAIKVLRNPKRVVKSIRKDGVARTGRKVVTKTITKYPKVWRATGSLRNRRYYASIISRPNTTQITKEAKLAIVVHLYYPDTWPTMRKNLQNIRVPFDLFVSVQLKDKDIELEKVGKYHGATNIVALPNRGRDVLPFLVFARKIRSIGQYEYLLKLHSKKSLHRKDGGDWLKDLLIELVPARTSDIIKILQKNDTGAVGPTDHVVSLSRYMGENRDKVMKLLEGMLGEKTAKEIVNRAAYYPFFGGTMFWCRVDFLDPLLNLGLTPVDFSTEYGQVDGTTAHAVERILGKALHEIGHKKMYVVKSGSVQELMNKRYVTKYKRGPSDG